MPNTAFGFVIVMGAIGFSEHIVWLRGTAATVGIGLTVALTVVALEIQLFSDVAIKVKKVVCGLLVELTKFPDIVEVFPLAEIPVTLVVLSRVQL